MVSYLIPLSLISHFPTFTNISEQYSLIFMVMESWVFILWKFLNLGSYLVNFWTQGQRSSGPDENQYRRGGNVYHTFLRTGTLIKLFIIVWFKFKLFFNWSPLSKLNHTVLNRPTTEVDPLTSLFFSFLFKANNFILIYNFDVAVTVLVSQFGYFGAWQHKYLTYEMMSTKHLNKYKAVFW